MPEQEVSRSNFLLSILGSLGAILIFALILFVAYLPNRPAPIDQAYNELRQTRAAEARAAGLNKLNGYEVINADAGTVRIPIERAMELTVQEYKAPASDGE